MKQCSTFEDLQALGTEKIHERTHISRDKVDRLLNKSYGEIARVQFMGYLSILEREYGLDLSLIKEEYTEYWRAHEPYIPPKQSVILQSSKNSKPKWIAAGAVVILALMAGGYFLQSEIASEPREEVLHLTTSVVEVVEDNETNLTVHAEMNATVPAINHEVNASDTLPTAHTIVIHPKYKVWYGMIDLSSKEKVQNITKEPIVIDSTKNWLIVLGHGKIKIETSSGKTELSDSNTVHMLCEKGVIKQITYQEFTERNGGNNW
jgi:hypothetical protein